MSCPCEPYGLDGLKCPNDAGRLLCERSADADPVTLSWRMGWTAPPIPVTAEEDAAWREREGT